MSTKPARRERPRVFCHMDSFPSDWNTDEAGEAAIVFRENDKLLGMGWFGSIKLDLNDEKAVETCIRETRAWADALEAQLREYKEESGK